MTKREKKPKKPRKTQYVMACEFSQEELDDEVARLEKEGYKKECKQVITVNNRYDKKEEGEEFLFMQAMELKH